MTPDGVSLQPWASSTPWDSLEPNSAKLGAKFMERREKTLFFPTSIFVLSLPVKIVPNKATSEMV